MSSKAKFVVDDILVALLPIPTVILVVFLRVAGPKQ